MRVLLGHPALRGDLLLNLPAIRFMHEQFGWQIDMPIRRQFVDMVPLFLNQSYLDGVVILEGTDGDYTEKDRQIIASRKYDRIFNPMQPHLSDAWFKRFHQTETVLVDYMMLMMPPEYRQIKLDRWFPLNYQPTPCCDVIAFAPFAGFASNPNNDKRLSVEQAQAIVTYLRDRDFTVIQLSGPGEPSLEGASVLPGNYFKAVVEMLSCRALIHTDTGMGWVASAYQHPQLGLYGHRYYGAEHVKNIQPVNPRGIYLDAPTVAELTMEAIYAGIDKLLEATKEAPSSS